jgi:outer membrane protein TolC
MSDKPKRGWLSFSIREIMLVTLIVALFVGWGGQTYLRQWPTAKEKALMQERLEALRKVVDYQQQMRSMGVGSDFQSLCDAEDALLAAELELCTTTKERISSLEKNLAAHQSDEKIAVARHRTGAATDAELFTAKAGRLKAEIALERAKAGR